MWPGACPESNQLREQKCALLEKKRAFPKLEISTIPFILAKKLV
jgi:hypothetical protein